MTLNAARTPDGLPVGLPTGPIPCVDLVPLVGMPFDLPCDDPWLQQEGTPGHTYLEAAAEAWREHPEWMDFLDLGSPVYDLKRAERDLYLHAWRGFRGARRLMDLGCGIGRMTMPFLDRGATVFGVDGDLESLRRCAWHAAGRAGRLDLSWSSVHRLPDEGDLDAIIACEVLCYVPDVAPVLSSLRERLRPGGALLLSWEAPWGWAAAEDAPSEALQQALAGPGVLDLPGERWVRTLDADGLRTLFTDAGFEVTDVLPTHYVPDGPLERCLGPSTSLEELLAIEESCRTHPVWAPLNRIHTVTAVRPAR